MEVQSSNKTIAKNTIFLYLRTIVSIVVNLYTMRLLWHVLGIDDYGLFNLVGGIVLMFSFLKVAMIAASQRFLSYELGTGDFLRLQNIFSVSLIVHLMIAVLFLILSETIGLWFVNYKIVIPPDRLFAANWVYQCSIISFIISIISVPYNACIVAHEHMKIYGIFGIIEVLLNLIIVLLLYILPYDSLICYSTLLLIVYMTMRIVNGIYCKKHFKECKYNKVKEIHKVKEMFSFASWSFIGNMGFSIRDQGINIILNLFFNVAVNAAKGIANSVGNVIFGLGNNFTMAINPQITKKYASGEIDSMLTLYFKGCKYALLLMAVVVIPLTICAEPILKLWLNDVAPYTVGFLQLTLIICLIEAIVNPTTTALQATGNIRKFQIVISLIMISNLPLSWIWLTLDANPYVVSFVGIIMSILGVFARLIILHNMIPFSYKEFFCIVYKRTIPCIILSFITSYLFYKTINQSIVFLILFILVSVLIYLTISYFIALTYDEKKFITHYIYSAVNTWKR